MAISETVMILAGGTAVLSIMFGIRLATRAVAGGGAEAARSGGGEGSVRGVAGSCWAIGVGVPLLGVINTGVMAREERYLEGKFGDAYRTYKARVRRWV